MTRMLKALTKIDSTQISLTGARTILLLRLLMHGPKTIDEISDYFTSQQILDKRYSKDTVRMDINCLKTFGFKISRADKSTGGRYKLLSKAFGIKATIKEVNAFAKVYSMKISDWSIEEIIAYHHLLNKIADLILPVELSETFKGISVLKGLDINLVGELNKDCNQNNSILISYQSPCSKEREIKIKTDRLEFRSNKLYLFGQNQKSGKNIFLNVSRIKKVLVRFLNKGEADNQTYKVKFLLKNFSEYEFEENETISTKTENQAIICGDYFNEFTAKQRMLFFGKDCQVLEPQELIDELLYRLERMRQLYE